MSSLKHLQNGRYAVLEKLGEGGKGIVYKARDTVLDRVVAIKVLKSEVLSEEAYSRVMREAQVVAKLNHPNIVKTHSVGEWNGLPYIEMELIEGTTVEKMQ